MICVHVCEYALRCWRLKQSSHLRSEFYDVHAGAFAAPRLCQVHVLGTNVRRYVGRRGGRAVVPTEAAPARLRPAWRHLRSRRRRPVRGVAFRKGVILWACKEAQDAQDEAVLDEWLSEALVKINAAESATNQACVMFMCSNPDLVLVKRSFNFIVTWRAVKEAQALADARGDTHSA